jgi:threonine/homoserine/homoserine lactone efflux protein
MLESIRNIIKAPDLVALTLAAAAFVLYLGWRMFRKRSRRHRRRHRPVRMSQDDRMRRYLGK